MSKINGVCGGEGGGFGIGEEGGRIYIQMSVLGLGFSIVFVGGYQTKIWYSVFGVTGIDDLVLSKGYKVV